MDWVAGIWAYVGTTFGVRPATVIGIMLGAVIFATALTYSLVEQNNQAEALGKLQNEVCNGQKPMTGRNAKLCQDLFHQLVQNPRQQDIDHLRYLLNQQ